MATFSTPRHVYADTDHLCEINKARQQYVDKYKKDIQANIEKFIDRNLQKN